MKALKKYLFSIQAVIIFIMFLGPNCIKAQPHVGDWIIPASFGQFTITVGCQGGCITAIFYEFDGFSCGGVTVSGGVRISSNWSITNNQFTIQSTLDPWGNQKMTINGTFNQAGNQVSGTYSANMHGAICSGNWGPIISSVEEESDLVPSDYVLYQNYPNPFNPQTNIEYSIPKRSFVTLKVYNMLGKAIATLVEEEKNVGIYKVEFEAGNQTSGIYFYQLKADDYIETKKMILLR